MLSVYIRFLPVRRLSRPSWSYPRQTRLNPKRLRQGNAYIILISYAMFSFFKERGPVYNSYKQCILSHRKCTKWFPCRMK